METKIESGDKKTENSFDYVLESYPGIDPNAAIFLKHNMDFYSKLYKDIYETMVNYNKNQIEVFQKLIEINKSCNNLETEKSVCTNESPCDDKKDNTDILPASGNDICNYFAGYGTTNWQIETIMELDDRLDFDKLERPVRLSVDVEPVLACRFIEGYPPYRKRLDRIDEIILCTMEETHDSDETVKRFWQSQLDMDIDPNVSSTNTIESV